MSGAPVVVVTGANGFVGGRACAALIERGADVRAVVRRAGTAPVGTEEHVGDFTDPSFAAGVLAGADAAVTTVHPMGGDLDAQRLTGVEGTTSFARAAVAAGVPLHVHISTCAVYQRAPSEGDVDESSPLVGDDANIYALTKRELDDALAGVDGLTRVLVRPPAILGPGETSVWNTLRPRAYRDWEHARSASAEASYPWVHVEDLAAFVADLACGLEGPAAGECTPVNVAGEPATGRDYYGAVADAVGVEPVWDEGPVWTGAILADRARSWGWAPKVTLSAALAELTEGLRG